MCSPTPVSPLGLSRRTVTSAILGGLVTSARAQQDAEAGTPTMIVPFSPGSIADVLTRRIAHAAKQPGGRPYVVENHPGGGGVIAIRQLLKRPTNGQHFLMAGSGMICNTPLLSRESVGYDPKTDLRPVCLVLQIPFLLVTAFDSPARNLSELADAVRSTRKPLTFASDTPGSTNHIIGEILCKRLNIPGTHVPYKDFKQALVDIAEGRVATGIYSWQSIAPLVSARRLRVVCALSNTPLRAEPSIQTAAQQGVGGLDIHGWLGLFAPAGTPLDSVASMDALVAKQFKSSDLDELLASVGQIPSYLDHEKFGKFVDAEIERFRVILTDYRLLPARS